jgi:hypothetical protein
MSGIDCAQCGHHSPEGGRFCSQCGTPLARDVPPVRSESTDSTSTMSLSAIAAAVEAEQGEDHAVDEAAISALPPNTALLLAKGGPNAGSRFLLDRGTITVGRHPESDIFLDDVTVSRRHTEIYRHGARFSVRDAGSLNGTYVNRERIDEATLSSGDEVQIGKFRLVYLGNALDDLPTGPSTPHSRSRRGWWGRWRR